MVGLYTPTSSAPRYADMVMQTALSILLGANTIAEKRIEWERVSDVAPGDTPRIILHSSDEAQTEAEAGTAPRFKTTLTMIAQCLVDAARPEDCQAQLRLLVQQVRDTLLSTPAFTTLPECITQIKISRTYKGMDKRIVGDGRILIAMTWRETFNPTATPFETITFAPNSDPGAIFPPFTVDLPQ